jgi:uncharacterized protein
MPVDHIRYDLLVQDALRGMVRTVLADAARNGLVGDHHFFVTFDTTADGVQLSERLREQYPEEMRVVLQHQFWGLKVGDEAFEVGLSFTGIAEKLVVPFAAIKDFEDPSVQFKLQFETLGDLDEGDASSDQPPKTMKRPPRTSTKQEPARADAPANPPPDAAGAESGSDEPPAGSPEKSGAEVVRLDRFRKK